MAKNNLSNNWGCWIGVLILIYFVIAGVKGCVTRSNNKGTTCINVISLNGNISQMRIEDTTFVGKDTIYIGSQNVYQNGTRKDLVSYMVKYTSSGENSGKTIGTIIRPNEYFLWFKDNHSYNMFTTPPSSTTVITRSRYGRSNKIDFTYLHFLDFADNIPDNIKVINY